MLQKETLQKIGLIAGGLIIVVFFVLIVIIHYDVKQELKDQVTSMELKNAELTQQFNKEKSALTEDYAKKIEQLYPKHEQAIKDIKQEYETEIQTLTAKYQTEQVTLEKENIRMNKLLEDPDKRIPILIEENSNLVKRLLDLYTKELEKYRARTVTSNKEYEQAYSDYKLFINVAQCNEIGKVFKTDVESFKSFADTYREFLKAKEPVLTSLGLDPISYRTPLEETMGESEKTLSNMEKENGRLIERNLKINSSLDWQNTGISVSAGDIVYILAVGEWSVRPKKYQNYNADGNADLPTKYRRPQFEKINTGALVAHIISNIEKPINEEGKQGKKFSFTADMKGILELAINDNDFQDNSGELNVRIVIKTTTE
ncbi:MAG: hypothetical protein V1709_09850 [Planctomycetota bacterium]